MWLLNQKKGKINMKNTENYVTMVVPKDQIWTIMGTCNIYTRQEEAMQDLENMRFI